MTTPSGPGDGRPNPGLSAIMNERRRLSNHTCRLLGSLAGAAATAPSRRSGSQARTPKPPSGRRAARSVPPSAAARSVLKHGSVVAPAGLYLRRSAGPS